MSMNTLSWHLFPCRRDWAEALDGGGARAGEILPGEDAPAERVIGHEPHVLVDGRRGLRRRRRGAIFRILKMIVPKYKMKICQNLVREKSEWSGVQTFQLKTNNFKPATLPYFFPKRGLVLTAFFLNPTPQTSVTPFSSARRSLRLKSLCMAADSQTAKHILQVTIWWSLRKIWLKVR